MGLLSPYTGDENTWPIVSWGESQEDSQEAKEVQAIPKSMEGACHRYIVRPLLYSYDYSSKA